jgi:hypothetical protein
MFSPFLRWGPRRSPKDAPSDATRTLLLTRTMYSVRACLYQLIGVLTHEIIVCPVSKNFGGQVKLGHIFPISAIILCGVVAVSAQNRHFGLPFPVTIGDKYGFMDANCHMVVPAQYDEAMQFSESLAAVKIGGKWGYIDERGSLVIPPKFAGAWFFSDGLASVKLNEQSPLWGYIDKKGDVVIQPQFGMPLRFSEGLVEGYGEKNKILNIPLGYMDKSGKYVVRLDEPRFEIEFLVEFSEGLARVSMRPKHADGSVGPSKYGYIDHSGKWVIPRSFAGADDFHEGLAAVTGNDGTWGYIGKTGPVRDCPSLRGGVGVFGGSCGRTDWRSMGLD